MQPSPPVSEATFTTQAMVASLETQLWAWAMALGQHWALFKSRDSQRKAATTATRRWIPLPCKRTQTWTTLHQSNHALASKPTASQTTEAPTLMPSRTVAIQAVSTRWPREDQWPTSHGQAASSKDRVSPVTPMPRPCMTWGTMTFCWTLALQTASPRRIPTVCRLTPRVRSSNS